MVPDDLLQLPDNFLLFVDLLLQLPVPRPQLGNLVLLVFLFQIGVLFDHLQGLKTRRGSQIDCFVLLQVLAAAGLCVVRISCGVPAVMGWTRQDLLEGAAAVVTLHGARRGHQALDHVQLRQLGLQLALDLFERYSHSKIYLIDGG